MTDVPKTRIRRTAEERAAWHQAKANQARASAAKQARALDTRARILMSVAMLKWATEAGPDAEKRPGILRRLAKKRLAPADWETFDRWWRSKGYPTT